MGLTMVVKRLRDVSVPENEFKEKIEEVGKMNNENLVPLKAYYSEEVGKLVCTLTRVWKVVMDNTLGLDYMDRPKKAIGSRKPKKDPQHKATEEFHKD